MNVYKSNYNARVEFQRKFIKRNIPNLKLPKIQIETVWFDLLPKEMALLALEKNSSNIKEQIMMCSHYQLKTKKPVQINEFMSIDDRKL